MRIAIDFQGAQNGSRFRGIGRYSASFVKQLIIEGKGHEFFLVLNGSFEETILPIRAEFAELIPAERIVVWQAISPAHYLDKNNDGRRLASETIREYCLASLKPDVVVVTSIVEGGGDDVVTSIKTFAEKLPTAAILYDLIPLIYKEEYLADVNVTRWYGEKCAHLKRADLLLAISESSRREAIAHLGVAADKVVAISTAIEPDFGVKPGTPLASLAKKFPITRPFLLYSGASDMRKNLPRLVEAFCGLSPTLRNRYQLVLAGGMDGEHVTGLKRLGQRLGLSVDDLVFTGYISDPDMIGLYQSCIGLVFASYHEGFGLPILEAMACGAPVIASNVTSIPEVVGDENAMFDPRSIPAITRTMEKLLTDERFRKTLLENGSKRQKLFSWEKTARAALDALETHFGRKQNSGLPLIGEKILRAQVTRQLTEHGHLERGDLVETAMIVDAVLPRDDSQRRLFIDVSELAVRDSKTGIQRVVRNIVRSILAAPPSGFKIELVRATRKTPYVVANKFMYEAFGVKTWDDEDVAPDARAGDIFLGLDFQDQIIHVQRKYYAALRRKGVAVYFVVYDILPQQRAGIFIPEVTKNHAKWLKTVGKADGLIGISKTVATEVEEWLHMFGPKCDTPIKIGWFHLGCELETVPADEKLPKESEQVFSQLKQRPTFLTVSTIEPRKRQDQILAACELLWKEGHDFNLVLVGKYGWQLETFQEKLERHPEVGQRLFWLQGINDAYLEALYRASSCLIAASIGEGFGLPLVEAARRKLPIIARDIPVFREVADSGAYFFAGMSPEALATAIVDWLNMSKRGAAPSPSSIRCLSWAESTQQLLDLLIAWQCQVTDSHNNDDFKGIKTVSALRK